MRPLYFTIIFTLLISAASAQKGRISGTITDDVSDTVIGAVVRLLYNDTLVGSVETHYNGYFSFEPKDPGCYKLMIFYSGYRARIFNELTVTPLSDTSLTVQLRPMALQEVVITYLPPLIGSSCCCRCCYRTTRYTYYDDESSIWFYPNPTTGLLNISDQLAPGWFYITDMAGRTVRNFKTVQKEKLRIDLSGLSDGTYVITYQALPDVRLSGKFVLLH